MSSEIVREQTGVYGNASVDSSPNGEAEPDFILVIADPTENMLSLSREWYVQGVHPQHIDPVGIGKIAYVQDDHLETDVRSVTSGMEYIGFKYVTYISLRKQQTSLV